LHEFNVSSWKHPAVAYMWYACDCRSTIV